MTAGRLDREFWRDGLHVFVLFGFAVSQPLLDILSRIDAFEHLLPAPPVAVFVLLGVCCFVLPAVAVAIETAAGLWSRELRAALHALLVAGLVALIALPPLQHVGELAWWAVSSMAAIVGSAACLAYRRFAPVRMYMTFLAPSIVVFPALFLASPYVSKVVFLKSGSPVVPPKVEAFAPVVFVVFDELPVTSLMNERRRIDLDLYPNFGALAEDATWYRNATAVADYTRSALAPIVSGIYPSRRSVPTTADYPCNIFTLLGDSYELHAYETYSYLCPEPLCRDALARLKTPDPFRLLRPMAQLYLEIVLPYGLRERLKGVGRRVLGRSSGSKTSPVGQPGLAQRATSAGADRAIPFDEMVESISRRDRPALYFVHVLLPHFPWEFLPSGRRYPQGSERLWKGNLMWLGDEDVVLRGYQRHLLQVAFVDSLLGRLLAKLRSAGLYERSLIVVTADHGISFRPKDRMRELTPSNYPDVLSVPLLIKAPYQDGPVISDRNVETVDILPTVADLLGIRLPWDVDGRSAADPSVPERTRKPVLGSIVYDSERKYESLERKLRLFGSGKGIDALWRIGPHPELVGRRPEDIGFTEASDVQVDLGEERIAAVDPEAAVVPALITGRLEVPDHVDTLDIAVAVNRTVQAVAEVVSREKAATFSVVVPETAFRAGRNVVEVFLVHGRRPLRLARTRAAMHTP